MILIDSHTHLYLEEFTSDIAEVVQRAVLSDVKRFIVPNIDSSTIEPMLNFCRKFPDISYPTIGLHPESVKLNFQEEIIIIKKWIEKEKFVAIGEIGIDLYWDKTFFNEQVEAFENQLLLAIEYDLPVIIHSRNALNEIIHIINDKKYKGLKGVFHCFPGSLEQAKYLAQKGFLLGIGGVVTYKNSGLAKIVNEIPLQNILLETDSPYLPPVPYRGKRNESAYILNIANFIAGLKGCSLEEVANITSANAIELFKLPTSNS
ncbi:MAG: TatD family hydrolase [Bacteroidetes bacterium]|nr:TatD family hydrolase [Bacteroidota bacterium]